MTDTPIGRPTGGKPINLAQLQSELATAGITVTGLALEGDYIEEYDDTGQLTDFPAAQQATVDQVIAAHVAMRDKSLEELSTEFNANPTDIARRQVLMAEYVGLTPIEQVPMTAADMAT
jgi:hypothetical protein